MYRERPSIIPGAVVWRAVSGRSPSLILPDGCIDVIVIDGEPVVAGPDAVARVNRPVDRSAAFGLRFAPGHAPSLLDISAVELLGRLAPLEDVVAGGRVIAERLVNEMGVALDPLSALEGIFADRAAATHDPLRAAVVADLSAGLPVGEVARRCGLSPRQLQRRGREWFGYGPKHCSAILRLQRALSLARGGLPTAIAASAAGYSDQAHLARDTRRLTTTTFASLIS